MARGRGKDKKDMRSAEGAGGIFRTVGSFLDLLSDMVEKGETEIRRGGELGQEKGMKAGFCFSLLQLTFSPGYGHSEKIRKV